VDFRNAVLIMTSNVGSSALFDLAGSDPERARKEAMEALRQAFRPEFINRIDDIVLFNPLTAEQLNKIVDLELAKVMRLLAGRNVRVELTPAARERVVRDGYDPAYGARPLRRTVQRLVQDPLAMKILDGSVLPGDLVRVDVDPESDSMRFDRVEGKAAEAPAAEAKAAASGASAGKSGRRK
jgi:ATP-dependent Clp protease ATP-binding subunit ClpB